MSRDEALRLIREKGSYTLPPLKAWNPEHKLRNFQEVGAIHLVIKKRFILGDPVGSGKTPTALYAWAVIRQAQLESGKDSRLWVVAKKSATLQWQGEVKKFLPSIRTYRLISESGRKGRLETFKQWLNDKSGAVLLTNWVQFRDDWPSIRGLGDLAWLDHTQICLDECHKAKNPESKLGKVTREIVSQADRVHALTATLVQNRAHDAYEVAKMVDPGIISLEIFEKLYCDKEPLWLYRNKRRIKIMKVTGYHHLKEFKKKIAHIYLGREDDEIDMERPDIVHMTRTTTLPPDQRKIYLQAEQGDFLKGDEKAIAPAMVQAFLAASVPAHYDPNIKKNAKAELLEELLDDEMQGHPVLVFTTYRTVVDAYMKYFAKRNPVRITGTDSDEERSKAQHAFQTGKTNLIFITEAGGESINLQRAAHVVMLSRPWAPGSYYQVVGRARRFGSEHKKVTVWHLTCTDTVDEYADAVLLVKMGPVEDIVQGRGNLLPDDQVLSLEIANYARRRRTQDAKV